MLKVSLTKSEMLDLHTALLSRENVVEELLEGFGDNVELIERYKKEKARIVRLQKRFEGYINNEEVVV